MIRLNLTRFLALQTLFVCAILASNALLQNHAMKSVEIGSPAYHDIIDEKDLTADTLPPPLYVTEAYMLALESAQFPERASGNAEKIEGLRKEFADRSAYWRDRALVMEEKEQLEGRVEPSGERFWSVLQQHASTPEEQAARLKSLTEAFYRHRAEVIRLVEIASAHLARSQDQAASTGATWSLFSMLAAGFGVLVSVGGAFLLYWRTVRPVVTLTDVMERLAKGDLDVQVPGAKRRDEIGSMARVMEIFREAGADNLRLQREAEAMRERAEADRSATEARAEAEAAERLRQATSGLARGLTQLANGDLSQVIDKPFAEEFEALRRDYNHSVIQLRQALGDISGSVQLVDREASGIFDAADEIGRKTDIQSAALAETAAALNQISSNVRDNNRRTEDASRVAEKATASAAQSASVVKDAVFAMQRIEGSSNRIGNIIGVIDDIAFQTNLLALNAGVEAARAGEAGRGFAVVAQEVRELAQRTAKAAREIKDLIVTSSEEVAGGVSLVRRTGDALGEIVGFIMEMNEHTEAIHVATRDQSSGLAEVDTAVGKMEEATRQNASMVDRQIMAAEKLASEASRLARLMERFRLHEREFGSRADAA